MKNSRVSQKRKGFPVEALERARRGFEERGEAIKDWAAERGHDPHIVYFVLNGKLRGLRGKAHHVAVDLGLKAGHSAQPLAKRSATQESKIVSERRAA
jgi:gp16 family phage-associated protein